MYSKEKIDGLNSDIKQLNIELGAIDNEILKLNYKKKNVKIKISKKHLYKNIILNEK